MVVSLDRPPHHTSGSHEGHGLKKIQRMELTPIPLLPERILKDFLLESAMRGPPGRTGVCQTRQLSHTPTVPICTPTGIQETQRLDPSPGTRKPLPVTNSRVASSAKFSYLDIRRGSSFVLCATSRPNTSDVVGTECALCCL